MDNIKIRNLAKEIILQLDIEKVENPFRKRVSDLLDTSDKFLMPEIFNVNFKNFEEEEDIDDGTDVSGGTFFVEGGTDETSFGFLFLDAKNEETKRLNVLNEEKWDLETAETIIICFFKVKGDYKWYISPISLIFKSGEYITFPHERVAVENLKTNRNKGALKGLEDLIFSFLKDLKRIKSAVTASNTDFKIVEGEDFNYLVNTCFLNIKETPDLKVKLERKKQESLSVQKKMKDFNNILKI